MKWFTRTTKESSLGVLKPGQGLKHAHKALERALDK
jgi:hypothetical protein